MHKKYSDASAKLTILEFFSVKLETICGSRNFELHISVQKSKFQSTQNFFPSIPSFLEIFTRFQPNILINS